MTDEKANDMEMQVVIIASCQRCGEGHYIKEQAIHKGYTLSDTISKYSDLQRTNAFGRNLHLCFQCREDLAEIMGNRKDQVENFYKNIR